MERAEFTRVILDKLEAERDSIVRQWINPEGTRTRHFVVDDMLPIPMARSIYEAFPRNGDGFHDRESFREKKRTSAHLSDYPAILGEVTYAFQSPEVVQKIGDLVGIDGLEPDPSLYAGGLSMMFLGDFLNPHIDNSHDAERSRYRRLNLLYYVSPDWWTANGGHFELWDEEVQVAKTVESRFNRLVVMETNTTSWHSVSPVLVDRPRCCVSNYYFSQQSPDGEEYFHVTSFTGRPGEGLKRAVGVVDNALRQVVSKTLGVGRGKHLTNK